jgi:hypothetical protein
MRGRIDLGDHKLANVYRAPARKTRGYFKRTRMQKTPGGIGGTYQQLWFLVDAGVRDALACHPEYLTDKGRMSATNSITKRVVGTLYGYGTQVAWGRSAREEKLSPDAAAERTTDIVTASGSWTVLLQVLSWARTMVMRARGGARSNVPPEIQPR